LDVDVNHGLAALTRGYMLSAVYDGSGDIDAIHGLAALTRGYRLSAVYDGVFGFPTVYCLPSTVYRLLRFSSYNAT
jgi:hypothetical protein